MDALYRNILGEEEEGAKRGDMWWAKVFRTDVLVKGICCREQDETRKKQGIVSVVSSQPIRSQTLSLRGFPGPFDFNQSLPDEGDQKGEPSVQENDGEAVLQSLSSAFGDEEHNATDAEKDAKAKGAFGINNPGKFFDKLDLDGSGTIDMAELRASLEKSGISMAEVEKRVPALFAKIDKNGDGSISRDEFVSHWIDNKLMAAQKKKKAAEARAKEDLQQMRKAGEGIQRIMLQIKQKQAEIDASGAQFAVNPGQKKKSENELNLLRGELGKLQRRMTSLRENYQDQQNLQGIARDDFKKISHMRVASFTTKTGSHSGLQRSNSMQRLGSSDLKSVPKSGSLRGEIPKSGSFRKK